ncbi:MAG: glycosyl transferase [Gammaproteobacteria bacterium HGW-Gammaproteobacteria-4]|jgi:glycosyltransferase involved in cell wall biosynthesis|nr:MAG: glycosyl transferase [Gammaproteobacteria bacterium HGW-Gammaproteobacteria-4]
MRVAIVSETYPPEVNGVALTVQSLALGLRTRGHAVELIRPRLGGEAAPATAEQLLLPSLPLPRYPGLRLGLPAGRSLRTRWQRQQPDAIYIATEGPLGASALRVARRLGIPVCTGFHTRFDEYAARYGLGLLRGAVFAWLRRFHNRADATLVPTRELMQFLAGRDFAHVTLLRRAVDTTQFHPARRSTGLRAQWGADTDTPVLIHVGRIAPEKNLSLAVRAFRRMQHEQPRARMVWVGDGPDRAALAAAHPDFVFCGVQRGEALARHFASADLFVFPSLSETFGNVTLEAMASGLATVAFDTGAAREHLRDGAHGAAIAVGDDEAFIAATAMLAGDLASSRWMGSAAREAVAQLAPETVSARFEQVLRELIARRVRGVSAWPATPDGRRS